ncbi:hypothetical protein AAC387_Pa11g1952 [Persea americana]
MPKQGPCCHCGITYTPLWRNGPPGKPVLCNACGSRWRTKGTLANYAPLHSRGPVLSDSGVKRNSHEHKSSSNKKPQSLNVRTQNDVEIISGDIVLGNESSAIGCEDDTSNRSSSGSQLSFSESTVLLGSLDGIEISGSLQSESWDPHIPSKTRTSEGCHSPSPVEKLRRDLYNILQEQDSTYLSGSSEEVLLFQRGDPMLSVETDLGSVLIKQPASLTEEKSEADSCLKGTGVNSSNDTTLGSLVFCVPSQSCEVSSSSSGKHRLMLEIEEEGVKERPLKRRALADISLENILPNKADVLESSRSPQRSMDLISTKGEDFKLEKEISSCSSQIVSGVTSLPTKKPFSQLSKYPSSRVTKGNVKAENRCSTNLHPRQASSSTNRAFEEMQMPGGSEDHKQVMMPHSSANRSTSYINKSSTILDIMREDQLLSSAVSCPRPPERLLDGLVPRTKEALTISSIQLSNMLFEVGVQSLHVNCFTPALNALSSRYSFSKAAYIGG